MCSEMLEAQRPWLPQFAGKTDRARRRRSPSRADCKPVDVPLDPALAINQRFATLIQQKTEA